MGSKLENGVLVPVANRRHGIKLRTVAKVITGLTGYGVWALFAWFDPAQRPDFLRFNIAMAVGTIGLAVRDMQPSQPTIIKDLSK